MSEVDPRDARIAQLEGELAEVKQQLAEAPVTIAEAQAQLGQNSRKSNKPPAPLWSTCHCPRGLLSWLQRRCHPSTRGVDPRAVTLPQGGSWSRSASALEPRSAQGSMKVQ